ncbi:MAG: hypothetical protein WCX73_03770 [Candidatus Pacearchaeota archaeon]|jgi:hypothetical protein
MAKAQIAEKYTTETGSVYTKTVARSQKDQNKIIYESWGKDSKVFSDAVYISSKLGKYLRENPPKKIADAMKMGKDEKYSGKNGCLLYIYQNKLYTSSSFLNDSDLKKPSELENKVNSTKENQIKEPIIELDGDGDVKLTGDDLESSDGSNVDMNIVQSDILEELEKMEKNKKA